MILIFGGAYNGKIEFIKSKYELTIDDIYFCNSDELDFSKKVICGLHKFTYKSDSALEYIEDNIELLRDKIIICDEISSGIVPLEKKDRVWREETGRVLQYLSKNSKEVYRVFCGIESKIK